MKELHCQILETVALIPKGKVATYGQIARMAGLPKHARLVGYVLKHLDPISEIPWHRVINSQGKISILGEKSGINREEQQQRLVLEGVEVINWRVKLKQYQWFY